MFDVYNSEWVSLYRKYDNIVKNTLKQQYTPFIGKNKEQVPLIPRYLNRNCKVKNKICEKRNFSKSY